MLSKLNDVRKSVTGHVLSRELSRDLLNKATLKTKPSISGRQVLVCSSLASRKICSATKGMPSRPNTVWPYSGCRKTLKILGYSLTRPTSYGCYMVEYVRSQFTQSSPRVQGQTGTESLTKLLMDYNKALENFIKRLCLTECGNWRQPNRKCQPISEIRCKIIGRVSKLNFFSVNQTTTGYNQAQCCRLQAEGAQQVWFKAVLPDCRARQGPVTSHKVE